MRPDEALARSRSDIANIDSAAFFSSSKYQKMREFWCAALFGAGYERFIAPCSVAVNDTAERGDADFFLRVAGVVFPFQIAEVQDPTRRRGDEYRMMAAGARKTVTYDPDEGRIRGATWIRDVAAKKVAKNYANSAGLRLLLYANFAAEGLQHADVATALDAYDGKFASIWVVSTTFLGSVSRDRDLGEIPGWGLISDLGQSITSAVL